jgi:hypothetical protein
VTGADRTALYRLYDETGQLLYVGITTYPPKRFVEHERDKPWWPQVARRRARKLGVERRRPPTVGPLAERPASSEETTA